MHHPIHRITSVAITAPYTLRLGFSDDTVRDVYLEPVLYGELYGPLHDTCVFNQVKLDAEAHTVVWPNGADFDPATLHDWPEHAPAFAAVARRWAEKDAAIGEKRIAAEGKEDYCSQNTRNDAKGEVE